MPTTDLYSVLGVLPDAEDVVISAAYRALAHRYHPDKRPSEPEESHLRMSEINEAYRVLGNNDLRAEYDRTRIPSHRPDFQAWERQDHDQAFSEALRDVEARWSVATRVLPDLKVLREALARISTSLAFSYVTTLLESRLFDHRTELAARLERSFLERFFGTSDSVVAFARELVLGRHHEAGALNQLVDVMGSSVNPDLLIQRIKSEFDLGDAVAHARLRSAAAELRSTPTSGWSWFWNSANAYETAFYVARQLSYQVHEGMELFKDEIVVTSPSGGLTTFSNRREFVDWAKSNLCPQADALRRPTQAGVAAEPRGRR